MAKKNTTPGISQLPSGNWQVRYRDRNGRQRARTFRTKASAEEFRDKTKTNVRLGTYIEPHLGQQPFADFALEWAAGMDWKQSTRESFAPHLRRILDRIGPRRLVEIDTLELNKLRAQLVDDGYARSTTTITLHYACAIVRAAYDAGRIPRDPTRGVKPPRRRRSDPDESVNPANVPTRAEVLAILNGTPAPFRGITALGIAGLRISEALAMTTDRLNVHHAGRLVDLLVDRQLTRVNGRTVFTGPKREKERGIMLPSVTLIELRRHQRDHGPFWPLEGTDAGGLLFRGQRDAPLRRDAFYESAWRPALKAAGLAPDRYVFHSLRHWCASAMLADGAPITAVAGHLGDTVETISRTYLHWLRDDQEIPANVLDRLLAEKDVEVGAVRAET